jgi:predicted ATP-dependent Lon-type protease
MSTVTTSFEVPSIGSSGDVESKIRAAFAQMAADMPLLSVDVSSDWIDPNATVTIVYQSTLPQEQAQAAALQVCSAAIGADVTPTMTSSIGSALSSAASSVSGVFSEAQSTAKVWGYAVMALAAAYILGFFKSRKA